MKRSTALQAPNRARLGLCAAIVAAFHGLFANGRELLAWDDVGNLVTNDGYQGLDANHLRWMLQGRRLSVYEPLAWLVKALEYAAFGVSARGFHLFTLALHLTSAMVFLDVARRLLRLAWADGKPAEVDVASAAAAFVFAVHPLRVEVVAWASGQSFALACLFLLSSIAAYLRYVQSGRRWWLALALASYLAADLSKSASAMLPFVLLIIDVYPLRRPLGRRLLEEKIPFFAVMIGLALVAVLANRKSGLDDVLVLDACERLARALQALPFYVQKMLWPAALAPLYPIQPPRLSLLGSETLVAAAALAVALVVAAKWRLSRPWFGASLAAYVVLLLPTLGFVQHGVLTMAFDRYATMATLAFDLLVGVGVALAWRTIPGRRIAMGAATLLVALTAAQTRVWATTETLWRHALVVAPESAVALNNLGWHLMRKGRWAEAEPLLIRAVALEPSNSRFTLNYGITIERLGGPDEALAFYAKALRTLPDAAEIHFNRGALLVRQGRVDEARAAFERAAELKPGWSLPREYLARLAKALEERRRPADRGQTP